MEDFIEQYFEPIRNMFFRVGIKNVTMDDLCFELGISKRTLYQKFSDKSQLVTEIIYKDFYNFKNRVKSVGAKSPDAIHETYLLFKLISDKQNKFSASMLHDLKKYYFPLNDKISAMMEQMILEAFKGTVERGIAEGNYKKNIDPDEIAGIISFVFNSIILQYSFVTANAPAFSMASLLDYHLNSICSEQGNAIWHQLKNTLDPL